MRLYHVTGIIWDTDPEDGLQEGMGLPSNVFVHAEDEEAIADALSDELNWCVKSMAGIRECDETLVFWS